MANPGMRENSSILAVTKVATPYLGSTIQWERWWKQADPRWSFILTKAEADELISQNAISKAGRGGRTKLPRVFTEHGALMAATLLNSDEVDHRSDFWLQRSADFIEQIREGRVAGGFRSARAAHREEVGEVTFHGGHAGMLWWIYDRMARFFVG
jgi:hypothetical protein